MIYFLQIASCHKNLEQLQKFAANEPVLSKATSPKIVPNSALVQPLFSKS